MPADDRSPPAGALDCLVEIQERDLRKKPDGSLDPAWSVFARVYASIQPLSASETWKAAAVGAVVTHKIICHWIAGVTAQMRVVYSGRVLEIRGVLNAGERSRRLEIMASENGVTTP